MSDNPIELRELIEQVKEELLSQEMGTNNKVPLFSVDEVELELQVTVCKEGKAGLQIHVIELGGNVSRDDVQVVKVTLSPLLSKEERIRLYKSRYPDRWQALEDAAVQGGLKGGSQRPLGDLP
ncbi:MAG TPA: trypco2 family protein [Ktedonobacteraceae bacterium]|nr:trypco2 family protein [Ktedonobacteraceae bacterium]